MKINRYKKYKNLSQIFQKYIVNEEIVDKNNLSFLYDLIRYFRPKNVKNKVSLQELIEYLVTYPSDCQVLSIYVQGILAGKKFGQMVSEVGISQDSDFFYELRRRISDQILPFQPEKNTLQYVLNQIFYKRSDSTWIEKIPMDELEILFDLLGFEDIFNQQSASHGAMSELLYAIGLLTQRMGGRSVESHIMQMAPEYSYLESPFLAFEKEFSAIQNSLISGEREVITPDSLSYKQMLVLHKQCQDFVNQAYKNSSKYGITLRVTQGLLCLQQQLRRVEILLNLLLISQNSDRKTNTIRLALKLIEYNSYKNDLSDYLRDSIQSVSYEITQHTANTGEHYITSSTGEYFKMLKTALGGGFVVGFMCILKVLLGKVETSAFGHAFLYSLNYAWGFIAIYLLHYTLATKQPAMTATTIIRAIEDGIKKQTQTDEKHSAFADLFARLFRSQFIAFVGNIIMAFPVALLLVWAFHYFTGINIVESKWTTLLKDASPIHSLLILHAAIAGVFLFLSGIISGNVSNKNKHNQFYYRIAENPFIKQALGEKGAKRLSNWLSKKWPGIVSNFWFGVFMGSTASVGFFLGLNLDIRHITFVSGNIAMGIYGANFILDPMMWFWIFLGLILVGFINFSVSFGLSLSVAFRSRNIPSSEIFELNKAVLKYFIKNPLNFFFPPRKTKEIKEEKQEI